jgi:hypothetical protein
MPLSLIYFIYQLGSTTATTGFLGAISHVIHWYQTPNSLHKYCSDWVPVRGCSEKALMDHSDWHRASHQVEKKWIKNFHVVSASVQAPGLATENFGGSFSILGRGRRNSLGPWVWRTMRPYLYRTF